MAKFCTKCGASLEPNSKFCTKCGTKTENMLDAQSNENQDLYDQSANYYQEPNKLDQDKKRLKPWQTILIAVGGVLLAVIIVIIVASSCGSRNKTVDIITTKSTVETTKATQKTVETTNMPETTTPTTTAAPTTTAVDYSQFVGTYMADSGGAHCPVMEITDSGSYISINIIWGAGMQGYAEWNMTAKKDDSRLVYNDCEYGFISYDSKGNESYENEYTNGSGYFEIQGEHLLWHDGHGDTVYEFMQY